MEVQVKNLFMGVTFAFAVTTLAGDSLSIASLTHPQLMRENIRKAFPYKSNQEYQKTKIHFQTPWIFEKHPSVIF